jgi:hypothetical protein
MRGSYNRRMRGFAWAATAALSATALACGQPETVKVAPSANASASGPGDAQHPNVTGPHGDHTPHHGGLVLMNGDVHYEVVLGKDGRHRIWFSDAVRNDLPATIAQSVTLEIARPSAPVEVVKPTIDESGESWVATSRPIDGDDVMVKIRYSLQGEPHEVEVPFVAGSTPQ